VECKRLGYRRVKKQSKLFCVLFPSDLISADVELFVGHGAEFIPLLCGSICSGALGGMNFVSATSRLLHGPSPVT